MSETTLFGLRIYSGSIDALIPRVLDKIEKGARIYNASINASKVAMCYRSDSFRRTMLSFDLLTADGMSIVVGARLCGFRVHERIGGIDLMGRLLAAAGPHGLSVYLLGARPAVLERAAAAMQKTYPDLRIAGMRDGYFDPEDEDNVVREVSLSGADLLFMGMGSPRKEEFLIRNRERLNVRYAMGVGGAFDVWAGHVRRAPRWVQNCGMEWFYRLWQEPRRLGGKYLRDNALFAALLAREMCGLGRREPRG